MFSVHVGIAPMRQFQRVPTTYNTVKRRETILKLTLIKYHAHLQHFKLPINVKIHVTTRGIWKALGMVFYLSNRFTNPIMFSIILKNYLSSMLWHISHEDVIMQTRNNLL